MCHPCYTQTNKHVDAGAAEQSPPHTPQKRRVARDTPLMQSAERLSHLQNTVRAHSIGQSGKTRSEEQNALLLLSLHHAAQLTPTTSPNRLINCVAQAHLASPNTVRTIAESYAQRMELVMPTKPHSERIQPNDPRHPRYLSTGPPLAVEKLLYDRVKVAQNTNSFQSLTTLAAEVRRTLGHDIPRMHNSKSLRGQR